MEVAREKDTRVALLTSCRHDPVLDNQTSPGAMTIPYTLFHTICFLLFLHIWAKTNHIGQWLIYSNRNFYLVALWSLKGDRSHETHG